MSSHRRFWSVLNTQTQDHVGSKAAATKWIRQTQACQNIFHIIALALRIDQASKLHSSRHVTANTSRSLACNKERWTEHRLRRTVANAVLQRYDEDEYFALRVEERVRLQIQQTISAFSVRQDWPTHGDFDVLLPYALNQSIASNAPSVVGNAEDAGLRSGSTNVKPSTTSSPSYHHVDNFLVQIERTLLQAPSTLLLPTTQASSIVNSPLSLLVPYAAGRLDPRNVDGKWLTKRAYKDYFRRALAQLAYTPCTEGGSGVGVTPYESTHPAFQSQQVLPFDDLLQAFRCATGVCFRVIWNLTVPLSGQTTSGASVVDDHTCARACYLLADRSGFALLGLLDISGSTQRSCGRQSRGVRIVPPRSGFGGTTVAPRIVLVHEIGQEPPLSCSRLDVTKLSMHANSDTSFVHVRPHNTATGQSQLQTVTKDLRAVSKIAGAHGLIEPEPLQFMTTSALDDLFEGKLR